MSVRCKCCSFVKEIECTIDGCKHGEVYTHWHHICRGNNHMKKDGNKEFITKRWFEIMYFEDNIYKVKDYKGNIRLLKNRNDFIK